MKKNTVFPLLAFCIFNLFYAQSSTSLIINDTRSINDAPNFIEHSIRADFKERSIIGAPGYGMYSANLTIAPWEDTDNSGGANHQLNFNDGGIFYRKAYPLNSLWGKWQQLLMTNIDGNVGIGTENIGFQTRLYVKENGTSNATWRGRIVASGDLNAIVMGEYNGKAWFGAHNSLLNAWSDLIIQADGGNVGIGMINPKNKLDVKGTVHSQEVKVDMENWSDFVFKKEYNLPTLEEVEKHITEKGHLENIPSEEEVLKNGINLGEMNAKLLQKIEELTLYSIQQNKKIEEQSKEIESLKSLALRVAKLEKESAQK
ncbi:cell wall anchor protein [Flavobacterium anhuiense]|uniref:cell wall anchor protein n=1 Tax=Flavobacterium anhuiense TaxID=459526 RepID=UPI001F0B8BD0|nr:cell wall anchor protein [Flavobacterium anhuiense]